MYVICLGGQKAAQERLARVGWRLGKVRIGSGLNSTVDAMSKDGVYVAFEPCDDDRGLASLPGIINFGFFPLPPDHPLYKESLDCLCLIDLTKGDNR